MFITEISQEIEMYWVCFIYPLSI